ncbi:MAG: glycerol-3-phosphate acyltransferase [Oscillibacter sp.]|jgi:glycerol-3-phosphate acyltransferase PlsY|nr:glycerol-3-phosphate acyltransferase [Oscillibacter sp.]
MEGNFSPEALASLSGPGAVWILLCAAASYLMGCFNGAVIVSKYILRDDVRTHGSGNAGLTNFFRTFGGPLTFVVILTDVLKTVFSVLLGAAVFGHFLAAPLAGKYFAGLFCMLGHMFPCMFHFKGGKGVLSGGTIALMVDWRVALISWGGFLLLAALTRYISLGSVYAGVAFPAATWFVYRSVPVAILAVGCGGLLLWGHRENMGRLLRGTERKFSFHHRT